MYEVCTYIPYVYGGSSSSSITEAAIALHSIKNYAAHIRRIPGIRTNLIACIHSQVLWDLFPPLFLFFSLLHAAAVAGG